MPAIPVLGRQRWGVEGEKEHPQYGIFFFFKWRTSMFSLKVSISWFLFYLFELWSYYSCISRLLLSKSKVLTFNRDSSALWD